MKNLFLFLILLGLSCSLPKLSIEKQAIPRRTLKMQGFYYNKPDYWSFMLYANGVFNGDFGVSERNIYAASRQYTDSLYYKHGKDIPYCWGLFEIKNNNIINIEHWQSREWAEYGITKFSGVIINDSTLLINHPVVGKDTFYFHYLPIKPDSTNRFIK
jgi:hypothetical protein